jgi:4-amino-4-deoxy-L-arabinose transferase-like glycosyltransferase
MIGLTGSRINYTVKALCVVAMVAFVAVYFLYAYDLFKWPFEWKLEESKMTYQSLQIAEGIQPYSNGNHMSYPPVYYLLAAIPIKLFGVSLFWGRLISFLASLASMYVLYKIVLNQTGNRFISLLSGVMLITFKHAVVIYPTVSPETFVVLFSLLGVYFFIRAPEKKSFGYLAAAFLVIALYTKHSAVATILACYIYLLLVDRKQALRFFLWTFIPSLAILLILHVWTDGWSTYFILGQGVMSIFASQPFRTVVTQVSFLRYNIVSAGLIAALILHPATRGKYLFWKLNFLVAWLFTLYIGMNPGVGPDIFTMLQIPAGCILFGLAMHYFLTEVREAVIVKSLIWLLVFFQFIVLFVGSQQVSNNGLFKVPDKQDYAEANRLLEIVKNSKDDIFCGPVMSFALLSGKKVWLGGQKMLEYTWQDGRLDPSEVVNKIENREFSLIIGPVLKVPPITDAVMRNYAVQDTVVFRTQYGWWKYKLPIMRPLPPGE